MILYIDTTQGKDIEIAIKKGDEILAEKKFEADRKQAEKLLPEIDKLLKKNKIKLSDLERIEVENRGGSFTALRIGVVTANALGYALGIPVTEHRTQNREHGTQNIEHRTGNIEHRTGNIERGTQNIEHRTGFSIIEPRYDREPDITEKRRSKK